MKRTQRLFTGSVRDTRWWLLVMALAGLGIVSDSSEAQTIRLKNGNTLDGDIELLNDHRIAIDLPGVGRLVFDRTEIDHIEDANHEAQHPRLAPGNALQRTQDDTSVSRTRFVKDVIATLGWLHQAAERFEGQKQWRAIADAAFDARRNLKQARGLMTGHGQATDPDERAAASKMLNSIAQLDTRCAEAVELAEASAKLQLNILNADLETEPPDTKELDRRFRQQELAWNTAFQEDWQHLPDVIVAMMPVFVQHQDGGAVATLSSSETASLLADLRATFPDVTDRPQHIQWTGAQLAAYALRRILTSMPPRD